MPWKYKLWRNWGKYPRILNLVTRCSWVASFTAGPQQLIPVTSEFRMALNMKFTVFWDMTPCSLADSHQRFGGIFCSISIFTKDVHCSYQTTGRHVPKRQQLLNTIPLLNLRLIANTELEAKHKEARGQFVHYPDICEERLRKTEKNLTVRTVSQAIQKCYPCSNLPSLQRTAAILTNRLQFLEDSCSRTRRLLIATTKACH
jgi:hypothetical protein